MFIYLTENLYNIQNKFDVTPLQMQRILYFVDTVRYRTSIGKADKRGFVRLNSHILRDVHNGHNIPKIPRMLREKNIIKIDDKKKYRKGQFSKGYKLRGKYAKGEIKHTIPMLEKLEKKIAFGFERAAERGYVFRIIDFDNIKHINHQIKMILKYEIYKHNKKIPSPMYGDHFLSTALIDLIKFLGYLEIYDKTPQEFLDDISIMRLMNEDFYMSISPNSGRMSTNLSNFPSEFRKYLRYKGKELGNVDIVNSQPLFAGFAMLDDLKNSKELERYIDITSSGKFYEFLQEIYYKEFKEILTRDEIKDMVWPNLFYGNYWRKKIDEDNKLMRAFEKEMPEVATCLKHQTGRAFAIKLQKMEADFIINNCAFYLTNRNIPVGTIHDSIVSTTSNLDYIQKVLIKKFKEIYNVKPTMKIKEF